MSINQKDTGSRPQYQDADRELTLIFDLPMKGREVKEIFPTWRIKASRYRCGQSAKQVNKHKQTDTCQPE